VTVCDAIPDELRELDRWVCCDPSSKRPMRPFDGGAASVSRPETWGSFEDARRCVEEGIYAWAGFVFADDGYVGIDIDHAFGGDGMPSEEALEAVRACASYSEVSKSGNGIHIVCKGDLPFRGRNNRQGWEIYRDARFFVLTGRRFAYGSVEEAQAGIDLVVGRHFADEAREGQGGRGPVIWQPEWPRPRDGRIPLEPTYPTVEAGGRHISLVSFCGQWWQAGVSEDALMSLALRANERYMSPPLPDSEVRQVVESCRRYRR